MVMTKKRDVVKALTPQERAKEMGHCVVNDPPAAMSAGERWTCQWCGHAVLRYGHNVYGSAIEIRCTEEGRL